MRATLIAGLLLYAYLIVGVTMEGALTPWLMAVQLAATATILVAAYPSGWPPPPEDREHTAESLTALEAQA